MDLSADWYERVLGFRLVRRIEVSPGESGISRTLLLHPDSGFLIGLYRHEGRSGDRFSPLRTGLDHLALEVAEASELAAWIGHLDALGVGHSPVRELGHSRFISLEDPDGIQLELWLTLTPHRPAQ